MSFLKCLSCQCPVFWDRLNWCSTHYLILYHTKAISDRDTADIFENFNNETPFWRQKNLPKTWHAQARCPRKVFCCLDNYWILTIVSDNPFRILVLERNNCTIICVVDVLFDRIWFQRINKCFDGRIVFVAFFNCNNIYICLSSFRIGFLVSKGVFAYRITSFKCIVTI